MTIQLNPTIPIIIKETAKEAIAFLHTEGGTFENDIWTVALCETGEVLHVLSNQFNISSNSTFGIKKKP